MDVADLVAGIRNADRFVLSRAITMLESTVTSHKAAAQEVLQHILLYSGNSIRIGITGAPGVGKSTFIEALGSYVIEQGHRLAVLAIDPTSTISRGSILGDKTRMEKLAANENAFIRPSPAGETLGGVARKTRETIMLCEAAGFDIIFVETVGVGQSGTAVHSMVDFFLLLMLTGAGDELQGVKRGIMEMADAIVINKADGENLKAAKQAAAEFKRALHLFPPKASEWIPVVETASAIEGTHIPDIWGHIEHFREEIHANGYYLKNRSNQQRFWLHETLDQWWQSQRHGHSKLAEELRQLEEAVIEGKISSFQAAEEWLGHWIRHIQKSHA